MQRRPWPILILAFIQIFVEPVYNLLLSSYLSSKGPFAYLAQQISQGRLLDLFYILVLPPIMGLCVYAMKKWSYALFMAGVTWMLIKNLELAQTSAVSTTLFILYYLGNLAFVSYFMIPAVAKPFIRRELRWWESKTRFLVDYEASLAGPGGSIRGRIQDFSVGGVFVAADQPLELNACYQVQIALEPSESLAVEAKPVFARRTTSGDLPNGYGLCFINLDRATKSRIHLHANQLRASNAVILNRPADAWTDFKRWCLELARTGRGLFPKW